MLRTSRTFALAAILLAVLLAARWLTYDLPFVDEWWSIFKSGGDIYGPLSPAGIWERIVTLDPGGMGYGYYLALAGWESLVGGTPFAVRTFSLLIGVLAIAMTYRLGAAWFSSRVGAFAAALMASSAFFVNFMHEARAYTLVALLACCVIYTYWRLMTVPRPRWWHYVALTLSLAGLAYSHYVALSVAAVIGLHHLLSVRKDRRWLLALTSMIAAAVLYLPWLGVMLEVVRRGAGDVTRQADSMTAAQAVEILAHAFSNGSAALLVVLFIAATALLPTFYPSLTSKRDERTNNTRWQLPSPLEGEGSGVRGLLLLWLLIGLAAALTVNAFVPFLVHLRYLIFLWPALALIAALGVETLHRRGVPLVLILGVWVVFGVWRSWTLDFNRSLFGEIYRAPAAGIEQARRYLSDLVQSFDLVLFHFQQPETEPFGLFIEDYLARDLHESVAHAQDGLMNNSFAETDAEYREDVLAILDGHERVWTLRVPEVASSQRSLVVRDALAEVYADCGTALIRDDAELRLYTNLPDLSDFRQNPPYQFGDETSGRARMRVVPGPRLDTRFGIYQREVISVVLGWSAGARLRDGRYSVAVHLVNQEGVTVAQDDYPLPVTDYGCRLSLFAADLPNGFYKFRVAVYEWENGNRLPVVGFPDGWITLHKFLVQR